MRTCLRVLIHWSVLLLPVSEFIFQQHRASLLRGDLGQVVLNVPSSTKFTD